MELFSKDDCIYCVKAKALLNDNKIPFTEISVPLESPLLDNLKTKIQTSKLTFPAIFIKDEFLGGFTELNHSLATMTLSSKLKKIGIDFEPDDDF